MIRRLITLAVFWAFLGVAHAKAQSPQTANTLKLDQKENMAKAKIADLAWLAGTWVGDGLGGIVEEVWSAPRAGHMIGMFRLIKDDKIGFTEFFMLVEEEGGLVLKLKHFDAQLKGWEEKDNSVQFPLIKLGTNEAYFGGLTFRKRDDGSLQTFVAFKGKDGSFREEVLNYRRVTEPKP